MRVLPFVVACAVGVAACSDDGEDSRPALRLNEIQVLGSHNSYHLQAEQPLFDALAAFDADLAATLEYSHAPLVEQFDEQGIRQIELDVFADPDGGRYADPAGPGIVGLPVQLDPELHEPGFKVLHVQDIDFRSTCPTLVACLSIVRDWSVTHPGHVPLLVLIEVKDDAIPDPGNFGFVVPPPITAADLDALDAEIRSVFADDELLVPDEVRGDHETLEEAIRTDGWPVLDSVRGQVLFALDNEDVVRDLYVDGHPALTGRVLFTSSPRGTPEAAFLKLNDALADENTIREAVRDGYVVRTRADGDTVQARTGETSMRDAALRSGAQWVSTDYPVDDPRFEPEYSVTIPDGTPGRCNPVLELVDCEATDVEDPDSLATE